MICQGTAGLLVCHYSSGMVQSSMIRYGVALLAPRGVVETTACQTGGFIAMSPTPWLDIAWYCKIWFGLFLTLFDKV